MAQVLGYREPVSAFEVCGDMGMKNIFAKTFKDKVSNYAGKIIFNQMTMSGRKVSKADLNGVVDSFRDYVFETKTAVAMNWGNLVASQINACRNQMELRCVRQSQSEAFFTQGNVDFYLQSFLSTKKF